MEIHEEKADESLQACHNYTVVRNAKPKTMGSGGLGEEEIHSPSPNTSGPTESHSYQDQEAFKLASQGKIQQAKAIYRSIILNGTKDYRIYNNLATICRTHEEGDERINLLKASLRLNPYQPNIQNILGILLKDKERLGDAIDSFNKAISLKNNYPEAHNNLGIALKKEGLLDAAIASFVKAIKLNPNYPEAYYNLGNAFKIKGDLDDAIKAYKQAIELKHTYSKAHNNLGNALKGKGDLDTAIACYKQAILINPGYPQAYNNLGLIFKDQGNLNAAITYYQTAIKLKSDYQDARWNLALTLLLSGDYTRGFLHYESRFHKRNPTKLNAYPSCSPWQGLPLLGKNQLLLISEQGLGDTLQFIRYVIILEKQNVQILICVQSKLSDLIKASGIKATLLTPQESSTIKKGSWAPLLSIPRHLNVTPNTPIITEPYLRSTDKLTKAWKDKLINYKRPIIGVNWEGNRRDSQKADRNFPIKPLLQAADRVDGSIISLQRKTKNNEKRSPWQSKNLIEIQTRIHFLADSNHKSDFAEYAAVIANCDLVITTATTTCHLAAAMGITTWVLLQKVPDWRWGIEGETSFWYPSIRLFRQKELGVWDDVFKDISNALEQKFSE